MTDDRTYTCKDSRSNRWTFKLDGDHVQFTCARVNPNSKHMFTWDVQHEDAEVMFSVAASDFERALRDAHLTGVTARAGDISVVVMMTVGGTNGSTRTQEKWSVRAFSGGRLRHVELTDDKGTPVTPQRVYNALFGT